MRFRPRYTVRTLAIFLTLVCAYFGAWEATKRYGLTTTDQTRVITTTTGKFYLSGPVSESSPMPFLIRRDGGPGFSLGPGPFAKATPRYYLWLFGLKFKLYGDPQWKKLSEFPNP